MSEHPIRPVGRGKQLAGAVGSCVILNVSMQPNSVIELFVVSTFCIIIPAQFATLTSRMFKDMFRREFTAAATEAPYIAIGTLILEYRVVGLVAGGRKITPCFAGTLIAVGGDTLSCVYAFVPISAVILHDSSNVYSLALAYDKQYSGRVD